MSLCLCGIISASRARVLGSRLTFYKNFVNEITEFSESNLGKTPLLSISSCLVASLAATLSSQIGNASEHILCLINIHRRMGWVGSLTVFMKKEIVHLQFPFLRTLARDEIPLKACWKQ